MATGNHDLIDDHPRVWIECEQVPDCIRQVQEDAVKSQTLRALRSQGQRESVKLRIRHRRAEFLNLVISHDEQPTIVVATQSAGESYIAWRPVRQRAAVTGLSIDGTTVIDGEDGIATLRKSPAPAVLLPFPRPEGRAPPGRA